MTQDEIIRMAQEADLIDFRDAIPENYIQDLFAGLTSFAELVAAAEREACAKLMDDMAKQDKHSNYYKVAAKAIRARSNT